MNKFYTLILVVFSIVAFAQDNSEHDTEEQTHKKFYTSGGGEWIFSFVEPNKDFETTSLRFQAWFHLQLHWHYDFSKNIGGFFGIGSRNLGYTSTAKINNFYTNEKLTVYNSVTGKYELNNTFDEKDKIETIKRRSYTISFPLGFKIGNLSKNRFLFFGGEIEFPFHYKNKVWVDGQKEMIYTEWFSDQTNPYLLSSFVGIQFPGGFNLKFKYYFTDLMNKDYTVNENGTEIKPFKDIKSQIFYISFGMNMFSTTKAIKQIETIDKKRRDSYSM